MTITKEMREKLAPGWTIAADCRPSGRHPIIITDWASDRWIKWCASIRDHEFLEDEQAWMYWPEPHRGSAS